MNISFQEIRGRLAAHRVFGYRIASRIRVNPIRFSRIINGRAPLPPELALRIIQAIEDEAREVSVPYDGGPDAA